MIIILILLVIIIAVVIWGLTWKKSRSSPDEGNRSEYSGKTSLPSLKIIRASDASRYSDKLQIICQNLKMESRIENFSIIDANEDLSFITQDLNKDDLILIVLTNQLESQKKKIENLVKPLQAKVIEIIADNVVYDNEFITFPSDLRPICERDDQETVWGRIEQSLKDILPAGKSQRTKREQASGNERLEAVKNHPEFPELLKMKPSSSRIYGRLGCGVLFGIIFAGGTLFINYILIDPVGGHPWYFRLILSLFTLLGIGLIIYGIYRFFKLITTRLRRVPALIVDKRTSVSGGGQSSSARTTYYVTVELDDGERKELESAGKLYGKITKDDVGVAYIRERFLLDFRRLVV